MKKKCESCRHFKQPFGIKEFDLSVCENMETATEMGFRFINEAREICNKEGDGIFVYFEPKEPEAGMAFVQITRDRSERPLSMSAAAGR